MRNEFNVMFENFMKFIKNQDKFKTANDLHPDILYIWMQSPNGVDTGRHIFSRIPDDFKIIGIDNKEIDCKLNLEFRKFGQDTTYVQIYLHKIGGPLSTGWFKESGE